MKAVTCPCGSGAPYASCCQPFHAGAEPPDAERLMRSRFAAFALGDAAYLWRTLHADHDERPSGSEEALRKHLAAQRGEVVYRALEILEVVPPDADGAAQVVFHASIRARGRDASFTERSTFVHDGVGWRYLCGEVA